MADAGFYNENLFRDYPFTSRVSPLNESEFVNSSSYSLLDLPQDCIVEFGAIARPVTDFVTGTDTVYLNSIRRVAAVLYFEFLISSTLQPYPITFAVDSSTAALFETVWEDSNLPIVEDGSPYLCDEAPVWSAFIVVGDLTALLQQVADGETLLFPESLWVLLPTRTINLCNTYVRSILIANTRRTVISTTDECSASSATPDPDQVRLVGECMVGEIKLHEGFNCSLRYDVRENGIVIMASPGAGRGEPCEEVEAYPEEARPENSRYFGGGPACNEVVRSINGVSVANLIIRGGSGFTVTAATDNANTLVIRRDLDAFATCLDPALAVDESSYAVEDAT